MKTVIEMAREVLLLDERDNPNDDGIAQFIGTLTDFAELVRADAIAEEREACAKECERMMMYPNARQESAAHQDVWAAAKAIRARSNT